MKMWGKWKGQYWEGSGRDWNQELQWELEMIQVQRKVVNWI